MRAAPKARQAKSKARINAYNEMASKSERERVGKAQIVIPNGPRLGQRRSSRRRTCARATATTC